MRRALLITVLLALAAPASMGQGRWAQTVQVVTPVAQDGAMAVLLDSLSNLGARGAITVRRAPEATATSYRALQNELLRDGLDITSANQVFISYHLEASQRGFSSSIQHFYFIYRPDGYEAIDLPILQVDAGEPAVQRLLLTGGTTLEHNQAAFEPFVEQVSFARLEESAVVSVGGRVIRDAEQGREERRRLLTTIMRFMY